MKTQAIRCAFLPVLFILTAAVLPVRADFQAVTDSTTVLSAELTNTVRATESMPPAQASNYRFVFAVLGNTRIYYDVYEDLCRLILKESPDLVFNTGGMVNQPGNENEWMIFRKKSRSLLSAVQYHAVPGRQDAGASDFYRTFPIDSTRPYYSVFYKNAVVFCVNTAEPSLAKEQRDWLVGECAKAGKRRFRFLVMNEPVHSSGRSGTARVIEQILAGVDECGFDIIFSGRDAFYERVVKDGMQYIVTGGGGAPLEDVQERVEGSVAQESVHHYCVVTIEDTVLLFEARTLDGEVIDTFTIKKEEKAGGKR